MRFGNEYGYYELTSFPGNSNLAVSHGVYIYPEHRGKGMGKRQHGERLNKARELGYGAIICTVEQNNTAQTKILQTHTWSLISSYVNPKTNHALNVWMKRL